MFWQQHQWDKWRKHAQKTLDTAIQSAWRSIVVAAICLVPACGLSAAEPGVIPGQVLVKFRNHPGLGAGKAALGLAGAKVKKTFTHLGWQLVQLPPDMTVDAGVEYYRDQPNVQWVEPNYPIYKLATPDDPRFSALWGMQKIGATQAWNQAIGSTNVVVAVVDSGVDYNHPDLKANIWQNPGEIPDNGVDDDGDGYVDDVHGIDVVDNDSDPMDDDGHGTHVAGTIGAVGNNGVGVVGVAWKVRILPVRILSADDAAGTANVVAAFEYLIALRQAGVNIRVINNSWGGDFPSRAVKEAFDQAGAVGMLCVCAAGNDHVNNDLRPHFPTGYDAAAILSVAASDANDLPAYFSNYGAKTVHLAAPGVDTLSTLKGGPFYGTLSGTSMASPHVSGAAAVLLSYRPDLTVAELKAVLLESVDKSPAWSDRVSSGGRLNLAKALDRLKLGVPVPVAVTNSPVSPAGRFSLASRDSRGRWANGDSYALAISQDARYVAFASGASNLVSEASGGNVQIYLQDRETGQTILASRKPGGEAGNGDSGNPSISADGRYLVFDSVASNLVDADNNGETKDVFIFDRTTGSLQLFSKLKDGTPGNGSSGSPVISVDGTTIAYSSEASNFAADDQNQSTDIFVQDRERKGAVTRVSVGADGKEAFGDSLYPAISSDGRYIAFMSSAPLVEGDFNDAFDIFVRDNTAKTTDRVSVSSTGEGGNGHSSIPAISGDGRYVAFISRASNLAAGDTNKLADVFFRDRLAGTTRLISRSNTGELANGNCYTPYISLGGRYVAFVTDARNLVSGISSPYYHIFSYDRITDKVTQLTVTEDGRVPTGENLNPALAGNGRYLAFLSSAFNYIPGDGNSASDVFVLDLGDARPDLMIRAKGETNYAGEGLRGGALPQRKSTVAAAGGVVTYELKLANIGTNRTSFRLRVSPPSAGWGMRLFDSVQAGNEVTSFASGLGWVTPSLAAGQSLAFRMEVTGAGSADSSGSLETALTVSATNGITVLDTVRAVTRKPFSPPDLFVASQAADGRPAVETSRAGGLSSDARFVAFSTAAGDMVANDYNSQSDVFLFDRVAQQTELISRSEHGDVGIGASRFASMSLDGRFVAFESTAVNLIDWDFNDKADIFVKDRQNDLLQRVSVNSDGEEANGGSGAAALSGYGRYVAFQSHASNLAEVDENNCWDIFVHDLSTHQTKCLSLATNGATGNADSTAPLISVDGRFVLFTSYASDLVPGDLNKDSDVFFYDTLSNRIELISRNADGRSANGASVALGVSDNGRYVLFSSSATDLVSAGEQAFGIYFYDRQTRVLQSIDPRSGLPPGNNLIAPVTFTATSLSPDGRLIGIVSDTPGIINSAKTRVMQSYFYNVNTRVLIPLSVTRTGEPGNDHSFGPLFSADGRFLSFRSFASNLAGEIISQASEVYVYDLAQFEPSVVVRSETSDPLGNVVLGNATQNLQLLSQPGQSNTFLVTVANNAKYADQLLLTAPAGVGSAKLLYFDVASGVNITSQIASNGWATSQLRAGESVSLRVYVLGSTNIILSNQVAFTAVSVADPARISLATTQFLPDVDVDGLPDAWELQYFGSLTAANGTTDQDNDGLTDLEEYLQGTNPLDGRSSLKLSRITRLSSGGIRIAWTGAANRLYVVERASSLSGVFSVIATNIPATLPETSFIDIAPSPESGFYRLRVNAP